jgi:hypothetical protein
MCKEIFACFILVSQLYVCINMTCYLTVFSGLDTCMCCFSCERTNLVVFIFLFSKTFSMAFYNFLFPLDFETVFGCGFFLLYLPFVLLRQKGGVFFFRFGPGMYF